MQKHFEALEKKVCSVRICERDTKFVVRIVYHVFSGGEL
jgi:hypothetical protein